MSSYKIAEADFILREDGSAFHIGLTPNQIPDTVILVGDLERVEKVSKQFSRIDLKVHRREFISHLGTFNGKDVLVISTGIGVDNIEIVLTEIDGLVNIDFDQRTAKRNLRKLSFIRVGTSGALQADISVDSHLVSASAVGLDNLLSFYSLPQSSKELSIMRKIKNECSLAIQPYMAEASNQLIEKFNDFTKGNTLTCPGFYAPQGRKVRMAVANNNHLETLTAFRESDFRFTNFEMETATIYAFAKMMGHEAISLNAILVNRALNKFSLDGNKAVTRLIHTALEHI